MTGLRGLATLWMIVVAALSLSLNNTGELLILTYAAADDQLFIRLAEAMCRGDWLGPYDPLTLTKGPAYPGFICGSALLGLPLRVAQQAVWLAAGFWAARSVTQTLPPDRSPDRSLPGAVLLPALFTLFALCPVVWGPDFRTIVRDNLYFSLCLALLTAAFVAFDPARRGLAGRLPALAGLGALFGAYYLTREEDIWLYPALGILALWRLYALWRDDGAGARPSWRRLAAAETGGLLAAAGAALLVIAPVWLLNQAHYGVLRDNDFRSPAFRAAYGALARIDHDQWRRYVVWPRDARARAYAVSPAARELAAYFEGDGARQEMWSGWDELTAPQFIWSLRKAAAQAGHFAAAPAADAFFRRLAREINAACDDGRIPCGGRRAGYLPVFQERFVGETLEAIFGLAYQPAYLPDQPGRPGFFHRLIGLRFDDIQGMSQGWGEEARASFARMTATVMPLTPPAPDRRRIAGWVYRPDAPVTLSVPAAPDQPPATLSTRPADDVAGALGPAARHAVRFVLEQACTVCTLRVSDNQGGVHDIRFTPAGPAADASLRVYVDSDHMTAAVSLDAPGLEWRRRWIDAIWPVYQQVFVVLAVLALLACPVETVLAWRERRLTALHALAVAAASAIAMRLLLVGYLEVAAIPSILSFRYIAPAAPCVMLLIGAVATLVISRGPVAHSVARRMSPHSAT